MPALESWPPAPGGLAWMACGAAIALAVFSSSVFRVADSEFSPDIGDDGAQREWRFFSVAAALFAALAMGLGFYAIFGANRAPGEPYTLSLAIEGPGAWWTLPLFCLLGSIGFLTLPAFVTEYVALNKHGLQIGFTVTYEANYSGFYPNDRTGSGALRWIRIYLWHSLLGCHVKSQWRNTGSRTLKGPPRTFQRLQDVIVFIGLWSVVLNMMLSVIGNGRYIRNAFVIEMLLLFGLSVILIFFVFPELSDEAASRSSSVPERGMGFIRGLWEKSRSIIFALSILIIWTVFVFADFVGIKRQVGMFHEAAVCLSLWTKGLTPWLMISLMLMLTLNFLKSWRGRLSRRREDFERHHQEMLQMAGSSDMGSRLLHAVGNNLVSVQGAFEVFANLNRRASTRDGQLTEDERSLLSEQLTLAQLEVSKILRQVGELKSGMRFRDPTQWLPLNASLEAIARGHGSHVTLVPALLKDQVGRELHIHISQDTLDALIGNLVVNASQAFADARLRSDRAPLSATDWYVGVRTQWAPDGQGEVWIIVSDNGPGFGSKVRAGMFQPFYSTKADGSGMGLYIVRESIHALGGRIEAFSEQAQSPPIVVAEIGLPPGSVIGAQFVVALPKRLFEYRT